jgi:hypothetical protein
MAKGPSFSRRWFAALLLGSAALAAALFGAARMAPAPEEAADRAESVPLPVPTNPPTEEGYRAAARSALAEYLALRLTLPEAYGDDRAEDEGNAAREAKEGLERVIVPSERRADHLVLVLALAQIEQGIADRNFPLWTKGEKALDAFLEANSWLASAD